MLPMATATRTDQTHPLAEVLRHGPFHVALRAAIDARGLGLDRLQHRLAERGLRVSTTSLSYWQHGRTQPEKPNSIAAVGVLEEILGVPANALVSLLGPRRARGPRTIRAERERPEVVLGGGAAMRELCDEFPAAREHRVDVLSEQVTVYIDAERREARLVTALLVRARRGGIDRYVAAYRGDPGCEIDRVRVLAGRDCEIGRVVRHDQRPILLAELMFGQHLAEGETHLFSYEVNDATAETTGHGRGFRAPVDQFILQVRFDPEALPARCYSFAQAKLAKNRHETGDLALSARHTVQLVETNVQPGAIGIGWDWP